MRASLILMIFGFALMTSHLTIAQDGEADDDASVAVEEEGAGEGGEGEQSTESTEDPNEDGKKELNLEDIQLWSSIDLDKDGTLTLTEFDRFIRSPTANRFVQQMKSEKAVKAWADKVGIDVAKAKQAMAVGAQNQAARVRAAQVNQARRQRAIYQQRVNRQRAANSRTNNYFANLGRQYYRAVSRGGRRDEL